jgi:hypothetical protein
MNKKQYLESTLLILSLSLTFTMLFNYADCFTFSFIIKELKKYLLKSIIKEKRSLLRKKNKCKTEKYP